MMSQSQGKPHYATVNFDLYITNMINKQGWTDGH